MRPRVTHIGNSRSVRLPKAGCSRRAAREGWAETARKMRDDRQDQLLDQATPTRFDEKEWRSR